MRQRQHHPRPNPNTTTNDTTSPNPAANANSCADPGSNQATSSHDTCSNTPPCSHCGSDDTSPKPDPCCGGHNATTCRKNAGGASPNPSHLAACYTSSATNLGASCDSCAAFTPYAAAEPNPSNYTHASSTCEPGANSITSCASKNLGAACCSGSCRSCYACSNTDANSCAVPRNPYTYWWWFAAPAHEYAPSGWGRVKACFACA